jgi:plastocyanin
MNKYIILIIVLVLLIGAGIGYRTFLLPDSMKPVDTGVVREITIRIPKNTWSFDPEVIDANLGDTLKLTIVNEDEFDHGVGIDAYGVSQRVPANATLEIPPFVVSKAGDFKFYCSVSCGGGVAESGIYQGKERDHFEQTGTICVHKTPGDHVCMNNATTVDATKGEAGADAAPAPATAQ